jgi:kinesin family protein 5
LGGNTKTTLVVTVAASPTNASETLSSLEFGARAKAIKNRAIVNVKQSAEHLERIIKQLRMQLAERTRYFSSSLQASTYHIRQSKLL